MNLSTHITEKEFTTSGDAARLGIDNALPAALLAEAVLTAGMGERIRAYLSKKAGKDVPILISSGYRCLALNRALKSKDDSDHPKARALDFRAPAFGTPYEVCKALEPALDELGIGQLIYEHTWVHAGRTARENPADKVITVNGKGYAVGIIAEA